MVTRLTDEDIERLETEIRRSLNNALWLDTDERTMLTDDKEAHRRHAFRGWKSTITNLFQASLIDYDQMKRLEMFVNVANGNRTKGMTVR